MTGQGHDPASGTVSLPVQPEVCNPGETTPQTRWEAQQQLEWYRLETERLRVLVDFLARPIHAHGGAEPDPDIVTAYNLAVEAALLGIRHAARGHA